LNSKLSESWAATVQKFLALNIRERWMIAGAVACVFYALFSFLVSPILDRQKMLKTEIANDETKQAALSLELSNYTQLATANEDLPKKQNIARLENDLAALQLELDDLKNTLIKPEKMSDLLSDLLKNNENLALISLKTLPTKGLFEKDTALNRQEKFRQENNLDSLPIFKHGVEMTIEGRYLDLLEYVATVEKMPWHVLWERANLSVDDKQSTATPLSQLTLTVYTLSLDKTWLSI